MMILPDLYIIAQTNIPYGVISWIDKSHGVRNEISSSKEEGKRTLDLASEQRFWRVLLIELEHFKQSGQTRRH